jgi:dTDP-4-dehydrorhamnose reductase
LSDLLVLGGAGMLGHKVFQLLGSQLDVMVTFRRFDRRLRETGLFLEQRVIDGVDVHKLDTVRKAIERAQPKVVVNCVGIIKQLPTAHDPALAIYTNSLFPHLLAGLCAEAGARLIHISTDCVFSGEEGHYSESSIPNARDLYGRTKLLGEVTGPGSLTLRTSVIGRELFTSASLVDWFLSQRGGKVQGYRRAIYTGVTTAVLSREIGRVIAEFPTLSGLYQVASDPISKFELLLLLRDAFGVDVTVEPFDDFFCDRSLTGDEYRKVTGFVAPPWPDMVRDLAADATPYERFRTLASLATSSPL